MESVSDQFAIVGSIIFDGVGESFLTVLVDSSSSFLWILSDSQASENCAGYTGAIIFNNAAHGEQTVFVQATYPTINATKNNIYGTGTEKSSCMWLEFGMNTVNNEVAVPQLDPICQDGPVLWSFYTNMMCENSTLIAEIIVDTNLTAHNGSTVGGNVFCVLTTTNYTGSTSFPSLYNSDAVTCIGAFSDINIPNIKYPPGALSEFQQWYQKYGKVVMGTVFAAASITVLFYVSWLRRAEEGDVVLYRLNAVYQKIPPDEEAPVDKDDEGKTDGNKRSFTTKTMQWYASLRDRRLKKKLGLAVVVRGRNTLQLRPLRRLFGYLAKSSSDTPETVHGPMAHAAEHPTDHLDRKGYAEADPSSWAFVEEEDDFGILDMSMFSIHTVLHDVSRGTFIERKMFEKSTVEDKRLLRDIPVPRNSTSRGLRNRSRRVDVEDNRLHDAVVERFGGKYGSDPNEDDVDAIPLLLDFDDILSVADIVAENDQRHFRGFFINGKVSWDLIDVNISTRIDDYVLTKLDRILSTYELYLLRFQRLKKVVFSMFNFKRNIIGVLPEQSLSADIETGLDKPPEEKIILEVIDRRVSARNDSPKKPVVIPDLMTIVQNTSVDRPTAVQTTGKPESEPPLSAIDRLSRSTKPRRQRPAFVKPKPWSVSTASVNAQMERINSSQSQRSVLSRAGSPRTRDNSPRSSSRGAVPTASSPRPLPVPTQNLDSKVSFLLNNNFFAGSSDEEETSGNTLSLRTQILPQVDRSSSLQQPQERNDDFRVAVPISAVRDEFIKYDDDSDPEISFSLSEDDEDSFSDPVVTRPPAMVVASKGTGKK